MKGERVIAISTRARRAGESLGTFLARIRRIGFGAAFVEQSEELAARLALEIAARSRQSGIKLAGLLATFDPKIGAASLISPDPESRRRAIAVTLNMATAAVSIRQMIVSVGDPGELARSKEKGMLRSPEAQVEMLCRALHEIASRAPETTLCLAAAPESGELPRPGDLALVREALPRARLAYWHDAAAGALRATRDGFSERAWLEAIAESGNLPLVGVTLGDTDGKRTGLPPGAGIADLAAIKEVITSKTALVVCVDCEVGTRDLEHALEFARS